MTCGEEEIMNEDMSTIFEQISNIKKHNVRISGNTGGREKDDLHELICGLSEEIQRVLRQNNLTQEDLCEKTKMSQSNVSKILNGKIIPRIETLQKIATVTNTRLIISFENLEEEN